jgi:hypothetical protein
MFFHFDSFRECISRSLQLNFSTSATTIIVTTIRRWESNHEKQVMIANGENQFD